MKFVIRDDDTCAVTGTSDLQNCYRDIWNWAPVSLSVTPFRIPGNDRHMPSRYAGTTKPLALNANIELVSFLREGVQSKRLDIAIHGYHHDLVDGSPEYLANQGLSERTLHAKQYLSELLSLPLLSFVPPHNALGKHGYRAVISAGLNLVHIPSLWSTRVRGLTAHAFLNMPRVYWQRKIHRQPFCHVLDFGTHKEVDYHTVGPTTDGRRLIEELDYCADQDGVFVLATHYHAFDRKTPCGRTVRAIVHDLLDRASSRSRVEFVGINGIW